MFLFQNVLQLMLVYYLLSNVGAFGAGSINKLYLLAVLLASFVIFVVTSIKQPVFKIKVGYVLLLAFLFLYVWKGALDFEELADFHVAFTNTNSGVLLFFFLGMAIKISITEEYAADGVDKKFRFLSYLLFLAFSFFIMLFYFSDLLYHSRSDQFLIIDPGSAYQRPGLFLSILTVFLVFKLFPFVARSDVSVTQKYLLVGMFSALALVAAIKSQFLNSNAGTLYVAAATMLFLWFAKGRLLRVALPLRKNVVAPQFSVFLDLKVLLSVLSFSLLLAAAVVIAYQFSGLSMSGMRITGFGSGIGGTSLGSRLELWSNFFPHLSYAPFLGHLRTHEIVGGAYVHSFFGMMLTHAGILLSLLWLVAFILILHSIRPCQGNITLTSSYSVLSRHNFYVSLALSFFVLTTLTGTNPLMWFMLGLLAPIRAATCSELTAR